MSTFTELRKYGQTLFNEIVAEKEKQDKAIEEMKEIYAPAYILTKQQEFNAALYEFSQNHANRFKEAADSIFREKREYVEKMLATAPTTEQTNLLTALQLRGADIDNDELRRIAPQLMSNYQAVKALQSIAQTHDMRVPLPPRCDYQVLSDGLNWAEKYVADRIHDMRNYTGMRNMHPWSRYFFGDYNDHLYIEHTVELFD